MQKKKKPRNYRKEYDNYHGKPKQKKRRAERNASRSKLMKAGKVKKGDKKDVHHKDNDTKNRHSSNLSVVSQQYNRKLKPKLKGKKGNRK